MPDLSAENIARMVNDAVKIGDIQQLSTWAESAPATSLPQRSRTALLKMHIDIAHSADQRAGSANRIAWVAVGISVFSAATAAADLIRPLWQGWFGQ